MNVGQRILQREQRNRELLHSCPGPHQFERDRERYRCAVCGGEVGHRDASWYDLGVMHGQKLRLQDEPVYARCL